MATASLSTVDSRAHRAPTAHWPTPLPCTLLPLYAQPLVRIAAPKTTGIVFTPRELRQGGMFCYQGRHAFSLKG